LIFKLLNGAFVKVLIDFMLSDKLALRKKSNMIGV